MHDELIDIVNEHDVVIASLWRSQAKGLRYKRVVLAFIKNELGQLAILKRTAHKTCFPSHWALVGGIVQSGELYGVANEREVAEEANLHPSSYTVRELGMVTPMDHGGMCFKKIYEVTVNTTAIIYNTDDFCELIWLYPHEVEAFGSESNILLSPDLLYLINRFYQP